jgi:hypothetical protein
MKWSQRASPRTAADRFAFSNLAGFSLARHAGNRQASYFDRLTSSCFAPLLALGVETSGQTASLGRCKTLDPPDGNRNSDLGTGRIADELLLKLHILLSLGTLSENMSIGSRA